MRISDLSMATGCHVETIRYYEKIGLIPTPPRKNSYRDYDDGDVARLAFVMRCRGLGFSLDETRSLQALSATRDTSCRDVDAVVRNHLAQVEAKQKELAAMAEDLRAMLDDGAQETIANCNVVRTLAG